MIATLSVPAPNSLKYGYLFHLIQAEDLGMIPRSSTIDIDITVTDWNDNAPVFLHSPYYVYLQEEATTLPVELVTVGFLNVLHLKNYIMTL